MLAKTIKLFVDKKTKARYEEDDIFYTDDAQRFDELAGSKNARKMPLIKALTITELRSLAEIKGIELPVKAKRDELEALVESELFNGE